MTNSLDRRCPCGHEIYWHSVDEPGLRFMRIYPGCSRCRCEAQFAPELDAERDRRRFADSRTGALLPMAHHRGGAA